jgi:hypothetical protein
MISVRKELSLEEEMFPELDELPENITVPSLLKDKAVLGIQKTMLGLSVKFTKKKIAEVARRLFAINQKKMVLAFNVKAFDIERSIVQVNTG